MSVEGQDPRLESPFPDTYPLPERPAEYEKQLRETIAREFPGHVRALNFNIDQIDRHIGVGGVAGLWLHIPADPEAEFVKKYAVVGEVPFETIAIMGGVYALTGAEVISDHQDENSRIGRKIMRKAEHKGKPVYFEEHFHISGASSRFADEAGQLLLHWSVLNERVADPTEHLAKRNPLVRALLDGGDDPEKAVQAIRDAFGSHDGEQT